MKSLFKTVYVQSWPCGYCHAMATKLCADRYLPEADMILLFDSDMMLMRPTKMDDLLTPDGPALVYDVWHTDYDRPTRETSHRVWGPAVMRSMGVELDRDWMISPLWLFWASTFRGAREMIERHCRMPFAQAVYCNYPYNWQQFTEHPMKLCDMQALGIFAYEHEKYKYRFLQRTNAALDVPIVQNWSHTIEGPKSVLAP